MFYVSEMLVLFCLFEGISIVDDSGMQGSTHQNLKVTDGIQYAYPPMGEAIDMQSKLDSKVRVKLFS